MKLRRVFLLVLTILLLGQLFLPAFAHSGRTDAYGGHYGDGGYHYHHGYTAHQHPNGTCPYNFDDQIDHSNNDTDYNSSSTDDRKIWDPNAKQWVNVDEYESKKEDNKTRFRNIISIISLYMTISLQRHLIRFVPAVLLRSLQQAEQWTSETQK